MAVPPPLPKQSGKSTPPPLPKAAQQCGKGIGPPPLPITVVPPVHSTSEVSPPLPISNAAKRLAEGELFLGMARSYFEQQNFDETEVKLAIDAFIEVLRLDASSKRAQEGLDAANFLLESINDAQRDQEVEKQRLQSEQSLRASERDSRGKTRRSVLDKLSAWYAGRPVCPNCKERGGRLVASNYLEQRVGTYFGAESEQAWFNVYRLWLRCECCQHEWTAICEKLA